MPLAITAIYAAILTLFVIFLAVRIGQQRQAHKVALGDGGVPSLQRAIRAHGNAVETIPLALILLALAESFATPGWVLHILGLLLVTGRVLHAMHMLQNRQDVTFRAAGMLLTVGMQALTALGLLGHALIG